MQGYPVKIFGQPTKRYCQTLDLREDPELIAAYEKLHSPDGVWKETLDAIRASGILEMEIYIHENRLFMIVEMPAELEWEDAMRRMASMPKQKEWEALTAKFQKASATATSDEKWKPMRRIFRVY